MCGIVGVLGNHEVAPILVEALRRLEYRGYDSAGIATVNNGELRRRRAVGKLVNLSDLLVHEPLTGKAGIGHTRWATHGAPSVVNAHPHRSGPVAVVHNGIIENFRELRLELSAHGIVCETETDTETIAHLVRMYMDQGQSPREAAASTIARLEGAFALCLLFEGEEDLLICARLGSPLAIGHGDGEMFVGSDAIALGPMTNRITYLEEGDWAVVTRAGAEIRDASGQQVHRETRTISMDSARVDKGGHKHFMAKEIHEQPSVVGYTLGSYLNADRDGIAEDVIEGLDFANASRLTIVACGTASYAGEVAKYWFEQLAGLPTDVEVASEFRYRKPALTSNTLAMAVSQSGETADTLAALRYCKASGLQTSVLVNVLSSTMAREADYAMPINAGPEIGVASTKAFTSQLTALLCMAITAGVQRGFIDEAREKELVDSLTQIPREINETLTLDGDIEKLAHNLSNASSAFYLGRGVHFPLALEGALKLKEISYIHAEGYAAGEMKHGPIALIEEGTPVIVIAPSDELFEKTVSNLQEVATRGAEVLLISDAKGAHHARDMAPYIVTCPDVSDVTAPIVYAITIQLLAYHTAVHLGTDVDQPRNLAKSVTVE